MSEHLFEKVRKRPTVRYGTNANQARNKALARASAAGGTGAGQQRRQDSSDEELPKPLEEQRSMPVVPKKASPRSRNEAGQTTRSEQRDVKQGQPQKPAKQATQTRQSTQTISSPQSSSAVASLPVTTDKAINASTPVKLIPEVVVYKRAPLPAPSLYIRKRRRVIEQSETEEEEDGNEDTDSPAPSPERHAESDAPSPPKKRAIHHASPEKKRPQSSSPLRALQETPRSLKEEPSFPSLAIKSPSPERVSPSAVQEATPDRPERDAFDDALEDLLGPESQVEARPEVRPKRPSLRQQMSARSDGESSSRFSSPRASPQHSPASSRTRTISDAPSPSKLNRSPHVSPARSLKGSQSAPDVLAPPEAIFPASISVQEEPARAPSPAGKTLRKTYAEMRTIRQELDITQVLPSPADPSHGSNIASTSTSTRVQIVESYADLKRRLGSLGSSASEGGDNGQDISHELEEDLSESQIDLASINQLRSAGENRRFGDEMDYLLEGLRDGQAIGIQRSSAVEIVKKLSNADFVRKLIACDYVETVYDCFRAVKAGEGDRILDTCLAAYVSYLSNDRRSTSIILRKTAPESSTPDCVLMLANILGRHWIPQSLQSPKGLSKIEKRLLGSIVLPSGDADLDRPVATTVRPIVLQSLLKMCSFSFTGFFSPYNLICTTSMLSLLARSLGDILPTTHDLPLEDAHDIDTYLQILETVVTGSQQAQAIQSLDQHAEVLAGKLVNLLAACQAAACDPDTTTASTGIDLLLTLLKLLVTVTNASQAWLSALTSESSPLVSILLQCIRATRATATAAVSADISEESPQGHAVSGQFDLLCLLMGLLEALLETQEASRSRFRESELGTRCTSECLAGCTCDDKRPAITLIAEVYKSYHFSQDQPEQQFLSKYCALVMIYASLDHEETVWTILRCLEDRPTASESFKGIMKDLTDVHEQAGDDTNMVSQLKQLINRLASP